MAAPADPELPILIVRTPLDRSSLARLVAEPHEVMAKYVVDVARRVIAIGGEMHADAEAVLLADGSRQQDLWGANYYPGRGPDDCIQPTSLINIRPTQGNRAMEILDPATVALVREITFELVGRGEPL
ncbi:MAG: DUF5674 family protein [Acidobacteriota bacterium]